MNADIESGKHKDDHSETEKAGMCSHWELMRIQSKSKERFFIMEHDTYPVSYTHLTLPTISGG